MPGIPEKILRMTLTRSLCAVEDQEGTRDWFDIRTAVIQGHNTSGFSSLLQRSTKAIQRAQSHAEIINYGRLVQKNHLV